MVHCPKPHACFWIFAWLLLLGSTRDLLAQTAVNHAKDEAAVRQAAKDYLAAAQRGDNKALADFWTTDGTYSDETGRTVKVRDLLASGGEQNSSPGGHSSGTT